MRYSLGLCLSLAFLVCNLPRSHSTPSFIPNSSIPFCHSNERFALLDFKNSLATDISASLHCSYDYPSSISGGQVAKAKTKSWKMETNCCEWDGVTCHPSTGHVITLDLSCAQLYGTIGPNSTLFRLHHLQMLNLAFNYFENSYISPKYGLFQHLTHLNLSFSGFEGKVPSEINHLRKLSSLDLSFNNGLELSNFVDLVENLTALTQLALGRVIINSYIPQLLVNRSSLTLLSLIGCSLQGKVPSRILELPHLQVLDLSKNPNLHTDMQLGNWSNSLELLNLNYLNISSQLPYSNGRPKALRQLRLYGCNMYGAIPPWVWNISKLIDLGENQLTGYFPSKLPNVLSLKALYLNSNNLRGNVELNMFSPSKDLKFLDLSNSGLSVITGGTHNLNSTLLDWPDLHVLRLSSCNMTEFPSLKPPKYLRWFDLSSNNIQSKIPMWLHAIGTNSFYYGLEVFNISHNYLTHGINHLPWKNFDVVDISSNMLQESIPIFSSNLTKLGELYASNNKLNGTIHPSICNLIQLFILDLSNNTLTGEIPLCIENLNVLNLKSNKLNGTLPTMFSKCDDLTYLDLSDNQLQGVVPRSLSQCQNLYVLNLGNNKFNGTFPSWLERLPELQILSLRYNNFQGRLISSSEVEEPFPMLQIIDISNNNFSGKFPVKYINHFTAMINMNESTIRGLRYMKSSVGEVTYSIVLTFNGRQQPYVKIINTMSTFDLSNNKFEGEIPDAIGKLHSLRGLNLSHNLFTGPIPPSIGNLSLLECLDLSSNRLTGHIPQELVSLTSLGAFNVSENLLEGPIPHGKQFDTFPLESYIGNLGLCGLPLPECGGSHSPSSDNSKNNHEVDGSISLWEIVMMGFGSGLVVGLAWAYYMFSVGKPFWFIRLADKMESALLDFCDDHHFGRQARKARTIRK